MNQRTRECAVAITIAAVGVLVAAFLPWGEIRGTPTFSVATPGVPDFPAALGGMTVTETLTGWNGNTTLAGVTIPNSFTFVLAVATVAATWLRATRVWTAPRMLAPAMAAFGLIQSLCTLATLAFAPGGSVGIGVVLVSCAFAWMLANCLRLLRSRRGGEDPGAVELPAV